jgi:predicted ATPase/class 3 adenylate cyclase
MDLPTGTVTFLYTDIEESTRRWEKSPAEMKNAVERHDELMREAIAANGGCVFRTMGDAFCASFAVAPQALEAALQAQRALNAEQWNSAVRPLRVRMSLHTGIGEVRDGDYVGTPLNRVARLLSAGYGGQILLSHPTYDLVRDNLPPGITVKDRGEHRLKDLQRPERIFEILVVDLPSGFPPLKTLDNRPNNLPIQRSPLIGRGKELEALQKEVLRSRVGLVTLTGPGGVGKTRLSLQAAAELIDDFEDGVYFVPLSTIKDPSLLPAAVAQALGVKEASGLPVLDTLKEHLRDRELLIVLDNFEQVISAAPVVAEMMSAAPRVKFLVTTRESLRLYGEQEFPVPPLDLPDLNEFKAHTVDSRLFPEGSSHSASKFPVSYDLDRLTQYEAVRLFIERAISVKPDFVVTNENAPAVAEICHRLDGLPLAIELAAARISILPPAAMLSRLQSRLKLLTGGARDLPARQQTLRGALMWSYDLLDGEEQKLFRRLAIFVDGCTLEGVESVCNAEGDLEIDLLDAMSSLINKSLLRQVEDAAREPRFTMLETIREYALERLDESGEESEVRERHGLFYLDMIERLEPLLLRGPGWHQTVELLDRFKIEYANIRAALRWSQSESGDAEIAMRMIGPLEWYYNYTGLHIAEGRKWAEGALAMGNAPHLRLTEGRVKTLYGAAFLAFLQGDYPATRLWVEEGVNLAREIGHETYLAYSLQLLAMVKGFQGEVDREVAEESVAIFRRLGNKWGLAFALFTIGDINLAAGEFEVARQQHEESLRSYRAANDIWGSTLPMTSLGRIAWFQGDYERARSLVEEGLKQRVEVSNKWLLALSMMSLADISRCQGRYEEAKGLSEQSLAIFRETEDTAGGAWSLYNLGLIEYYQGKVASGEALLKETLALRKEQGNKEGLTLCTAGLAQTAAASGRYERAARLFGAAEGLFNAGVARLSPADREKYEVDKEAARASLSAKSFDALRAEGAAMTLNEAVGLALS